MSMVIKFGWLSRGKNIALIIGMSILPLFQGPKAITQPLPLPPFSLSRLGYVPDVAITWDFYRLPFSIIGFRGLEITIEFFIFIYLL